MLVTSRNKLVIHFAKVYIFGENMGIYPGRRREKYGPYIICKYFLVLRDIDAVACHKTVVVPPRFQAGITKQNSLRELEGPRKRGISGLVTWEFVIVKVHLS